MLGISLAALILAEAAPAWSPLSYFVPFTFLGNSLAPLPYDGAVVYLGARYPLWVILPIAVAATLLIEAWNMELLARMLVREGTRAFRNHRFTQGSLRQLSVILGRGTRYSGLVLVGVALPIPGPWIVLASLVILAFGVKGARGMNRSKPESAMSRSAEAAIPEEA
jgi:hypothetical protein